MKKEKSLLVIALVQDIWVPESLGGDGGNGPAAPRKFAFEGCRFTPTYPPCSSQCLGKLDPPMKGSSDTPKD